MKIYLVRHGRTEANSKGDFNGVVDEPISEEGYEDLLVKRRLYEGLKFDYGYCSPLKRAVKTFEVLFPDKKIDELRDDLTEMDFGDWAGQNIQKVITEYVALGYTLENFMDPPHGETYVHLYQRTSDFINEVINKHHDNEQIIVVSHGLVIGTIVDYFDIFKDKSALELAPDNGLGYIMDVEDKQVKDIEIIKG
jgi:alpha-ribazole phosphatase